MKLKVSLFALAALATSASAVTIDIVGSTAGRTAVYNRVLDLIVETRSAASGSSLTGSNQAIIHGTYDSGSGAVPVIIRLNFTGSAAGVNEVANQVQTNFFKETKNDGVTIGETGAANQTSVAFSGGNIETSAPELGYSDVFQATTSFATPVMADEAEVAVIPFKFYRHNNGSSLLTNITAQQARALFGGLGELPLSFFTGNAADSASVYATGRDGLSGTRITTFAEVATSQTAVSQYQPTTSAGNGTGSVNALGSTSTGGFTSGSFVANVLNSTFGGGTIVGYLGASDWPENAVTPAPNVALDAQPLTYNGVPYSTEAVYNGQYTFWGYLHQFRQTLTGDALDFYDDLAAALTANPGSGVLNIANMSVVRGGDGAKVEQP